MGNAFCPPAVGEDNVENADFEIHASFEPIISRYDAFILDQWGVMHNGLEPMEGAIDCVKRLAREGKKLAILSNTSSSEPDALARLEPLGFGPSDFVAGAITSGDLATEYIRTMYGKTKKKALVMAWKHPSAPDSQEFIERCGGITLVDSLDNDKDIPDVIILHGNEIILPPTKDADEKSLGNFVLDGKLETVLLPLLEKCHARSIPLLCVDPDLVTVNPDGTVLYMPGTIAEHYAKKLGGPTLYFGKPSAQAFQRAVDRLVESHGIPKDRICHVGDSLHHDIQGANTIDLDSTLVLGGVHRVELENKLGDLVPRTKLHALCHKIGAMPTHVAPMLRL